MLIFRIFWYFLIEDLGGTRGFYVNKLQTQSLDKKSEKQQKRTSSFFLGAFRPIDILNSTLQQ